MTALSEYDRLEAPGLWRADDDAQRLNVVVSLGDATLTISDTHDRPLAHWSLPAVRRKNAGDTPAIFAPSSAADETEELELDDETMIEAIERVRRAIARARPRTGRLRLALTVLVLASLGTLAVTWLPGALKRQTLSVLPDVTRAAVGERLLTRIRRVAGSPCSAPLGLRALDKLALRTLGTAPAPIAVLSQGVTWTAHLPGPILLMNRALVEDYEEPDVAAGFLLLETARAKARDPMLDLLEHAGLVATVKLLTTGEIADTVLDSYAEILLTAPPVEVPLDTLIAGFDAARLRTTPFAYALDPSGEDTIAVIEADPVPLSEAEPLLPDADWVALQGICGG